nr:MAG TPA: Terminase small subunit [Caudoviricetes sp.]
MAKANAPKHELAEDDYMSGMQYKDIADKYGVSINTVKSWKRRHYWERVEPKNKKKHNKKFKQPIAKEVNSVMQNNELTEKQRLFCLYFVKLFNATKAYQKAYGCGECTARTNGYKLLLQPKIKAEIEKLKKEKLNQLYLTQEDIFQKYMDIAFADMTDYVRFVNEQKSIKDKTGKVKKLTVSHVHFRDDSEVDGTLISEIGEGPKGIQIKLGDRMKALNWLTAHMDMGTSEQKVKVELLKKKLEEGDNDKNNVVDDWIEAVQEEEDNSG